MTIASAPVRYTPQDIERLSDQDGKLYELVGGHLVEKVVMSTRSIWVATRISHLLQSIYPPTRAYVLVEQPTYCFPDGDMRRPDVAMVWAERLPDGLTDDDLHIAPDFVVEVVSPSNTVDDQFQRVKDYLDAGVPIVCVAHPLLRWLHVYRKDRPASVLHAEDTFQDEPRLPGLKLKVADIFPPEPAQKIGS